MPTRRRRRIALRDKWAACWLGQLGGVLSLAGLVFASGCSVQGKQSPPPPVPVRPTLTELVPNTASIGGAGTLILRGGNFVPGATLSAPPGLSFRNIRVDGPAQITADYAISPDSVLGYFGVKVTTPGGTSDPVTFTIIPLAYQFGFPARPEAPTGPPVFESLQVGIHAAQIPNPDGSSTDGYLDVAFTDDKGHKVTVGDSWHSDMDNVDNPDDDTDESDVAHTVVTSYSFSVEKPAPGRYVLHIKGAKSGSFTLEMNADSSSPDNGSSDSSLAALEKIPTYPGSSFALKFICQRDPYGLDIDSGGLQPAHGAFSFAQPLSSEVRLPAEEKELGVVIYYDPVMEASSFRALLDGSERTSLFHVRLGELEMVTVPLEAGRHVLKITANNKKTGLLTEQEFHIQH